MPAPSFVDTLTWSRIYKIIYGLGNLKGFEGFREYFFENVEKFQKI